MNQNQVPGSKDAEEAETAAESLEGSDKADADEDAVETPAGEPMEEDSVSPAAVFCIRLKQPRSNLLHKMSVPELCRNFR